MSSLLLATCNLCDPPERLHVWQIPEHLAVVHGLSMAPHRLSFRERRLLHEAMGPHRWRRRRTPRWRRVLD